MQSSLANSARLDSFVCTQEDQGTRNLLAVVYFDCHWFEPLTRRLAINDLKWHDLSVPLNHLEDFDPWSQLVLEHTQRTVGKVQPFDAAASEKYISPEEEAYVQLLIANIDPENKKVGLETLCKLYRSGQVLREAHVVVVHAMGLLHDPVHAFAVGP